MAIKKRHVFNITHESETDDCVYTGTFSCKRLSVKDLAMVTVIKTRLNGGYHHDPEQPGCGVDLQTDNLNHMLAHLELSIVDAPDWWDLTEIGDVAVMSAVYNEVAGFEASFRKRKGDSDGRGEEGGQTNDQGADLDGAAGQVVGNQVPASLEP